MRHEGAVHCLHWNIIRHRVLQESTECSQLECLGESEHQVGGGRVRGAEGCMTVAPQLGEVVVRSHLETTRL